MVHQVALNVTLATTLWHLHQLAYRVQVVRISVLKENPHAHHVILWEHMQMLEALLVSDVQLEPMLIQHQLLYVHLVLVEIFQILLDLQGVFLAPLGHTLSMAKLHAHFVLRVHTLRQQVFHFAWIALAETFLIQQVQQDADNV